MDTLLKAFMGLVVAVLFFGGMSYVPDPYGTYIWQGAALGGLTVAAMFLVGAPMTYMMNIYAYKPFVPRLIMGLVGLVFFPVILGLMFFRPKTHYFGLMPLLGGCSSGTGGNSLLDYLYAIWCTLVEPLAFYTDGPDDRTELINLITRAAGYGEGVNTMPAVNFEQALRIATIDEPDIWNSEYSNLVQTIHPTQQAPSQ